MKEPKIHYSGGVRTPRMKILPGWAVCCSGIKAENIKDKGYSTDDTADVTCRACLRIMAKDESIFFGKFEDPCALGHE